VAVGLRHDGAAPAGRGGLRRQFKWYFGKGPRPRFGRYGYLEKMDYFGEVWGFIVIGGSGFMLWFPEFFGQWLPGWLFNVATVFHAYEAMIAAAFLFTIHFFNVHLRPDKFPLDAVMFTGRGTLDYMIEEHPGMEEELRESAKRPGQPPGDPRPAGAAAVADAHAGRHVPSASSRGVSDSQSSG
jgi:hypothetical protein